MIVVIFDMRGGCKNPFFPFRGIPEDANPDDYEVIVVENGSSEPYRRSL